MYKFFNVIISAVDFAWSWVIVCSGQQCFFFFIQIPSDCHKISNLQSRHLTTYQSNVPIWSYLIVKMSEQTKIGPIYKKKLSQSNILNYKLGTFLPPHYTDTKKKKEKIEEDKFLHAMLYPSTWVANVITRPCWH